PYFSIQTFRTSSGRRQMIPELTAVLPPTQLPCSKRMGCEPEVAVVPAPRTAWRRDSSSALGRSLRAKLGPSSISTTLRPAPLSTRAAVAPPAPVPTITKSASSSTTAPIRRPWGYWASEWKEVEDVGQLWVLLGGSFVSKEGSTKVQH